MCFIKFYKDLFPPADRRRSGIPVIRRLACAAVFLGALSGFTACFAHAAGPVVRIPELKFPSGEDVVVPIEISGVPGADIGGYVLRLDYDETVLTKPTAAASGTLSEHIEFTDGICPADQQAQWDYAIGIGFGFAPSEDGVLIKIRFRVSGAFTAGTTRISFVNPNAETGTCLYRDLMANDFEWKIIPAEFVDGSVTVEEKKHRLKGEIQYHPQPAHPVCVQAFELRDTLLNAPVDMDCIESDCPFSLSVPPGEYVLKAFIDINKNGITDAEEPTSDYRHIITAETHTDFIRFPFPPPALTITSPISGTTAMSPIPATARFTHPVTGFHSEDIMISNGLSHGFPDAGGVFRAAYSFEILPVDEGPVTIDIGENIAEDEAGHGNEAAEQFLLAYFLPEPPEIHYAPCDFNRDETIDAVDLELFKDHWLSSCDDPGWDSGYDLEPDGVIDIFDLAYFGDEFGDQLTGNSGVHPQ
ncbi:MAG: hypothetical protein CSB33_04720 [Desulfobacterales bacterium]|nr:MAG: hypothetical protein CSB33_04720 [Desulfobacterales bacterium]